MSFNEFLHVSQHDSGPEYLDHSKTANSFFPWEYTVSIAEFKSRYNEKTTGIDLIGKMFPFFLKKRLVKLAIQIYIICSETTQTRSFADESL